MSNRWILPAGLVIAGFLLFYLFQKYRVAPEMDFGVLELRDTMGNKVSLADRKGKKMVICFSASWCGPCRAELQAIHQVKAEVLPDAEIVVISDEPMEKVKMFGGMTGYPFLFLKSERPLAELGIHSIPTSYLVNSSMKVVKEEVGYIDWKDPSTAEHLRKLMEGS